jgi:hypothetical protein
MQPARKPSSSTESLHCCPMPLPVEGQQRFEGSRLAIAAIRQYLTVTGDCFCAVRPRRPPQNNLPGSPGRAALPRYELVRPHNRADYRALDAAPQGPTENDGGFRVANGQVHD